MVEYVDVTVTIAQKIVRACMVACAEAKAFLHQNTCWSCGCVFTGDVCPNCLVTYEVKP